MCILCTVRSSLFMETSIIEKLVTERIASWMRHLAVEVCGETGFYFKFNTTDM